MPTVTVNAELGRDPTRTVTLRRDYTRAFSRRWRWLKGAIREGVGYTHDGLGLSQDPPDRPVLLQQSPEVRESLNRLRRLAQAARAEGNFDRAREIARQFIATDGRFAFPTSAEKLNAFSGWLDEAVDAGIVEVELDDAGEIVERAGWQRVYVERAYAKGVSSADANLRQAGVDVSPRFDDVKRTLQMPVHSDALELLYSRNLDELKGVTEAAGQQMRRTLAEGFAEGINPRRTASLLNQRVDAVGLHRSRMIARTETIRAHSEATLNRYKQFGVGSVKGRAELATAGDDRVCSICAGLEGEVFKLEEARGLIPVHPQCLPGDVRIAPRGRVTGCSKRWFDGDLVVIETAAGHVLSCTPNHPVFTGRGFQPASTVDIGDDMVRDRARQRVGSGDGDDVDGPALAHEMAEAFFGAPEVVAMPVPVSSEDFHGDGRDGEVAVVGTDSLLQGDTRDAPFGEHAPQSPFGVGDMRLALLAGLRGLAKGLPATGHAPRRLVCRRHLLSALLLRHLLPLDPLRFAAAANVNARLLKSLVDGTARDTVGIGQGVDGLSGQVSLDDLSGGQVPALSAGRAHLDAGILEAPGDGGRPERVLLRQLRRGESAPVVTDEIVRVDHRSYSGWVYNFQTTEGYFFANGLATHNCRCAWLPVVDTDSVSINRTAARWGHRKRQAFPDWYRRVA